MSNPIQFLLHQLATNEQDQRKFLILPLNSAPNHHILKQIQSGRFAMVELAHYLADVPDQCEKFIRTCLSRVNGEPVLSIFQDRLYVSKSLNAKSLNIYLYEVFDHPLRNGKPLDEGISNLHDKMLELVPEYEEFLNNNK